MFVESVQMSGHRELAGDAVLLGRFECLRDGDRKLRALRDAIRLPLGLVDGALLRSVLEDWGCRDIELGEGQGLTEWARWTDGHGLAAVLAPAPDRTIRVRCRYRLDPVQFGRLRAAAVRDPRLVDALAGGPTLDLSVGLQFHPGLEGAGLDALAIEVGGTAIPARGPDRPPWLGPFLAGLVGRVRAAPLAPADWHVAASAWSFPRQRALATALDALQGAPARLGRLLPLPGEPARVEDDTLVPLRLLGHTAESAVGWTGAALLAGADILVASGAPDSAAWQRWWRAQAESDNSPLEQVILLGAKGGRRLDP